MNPIRGPEISFDAPIAGLSTLTWRVRPATLIPKIRERLTQFEAELTALLVIAPFAIALLMALGAF
jgi:hypothetical protein